MSGIEAALWDLNGKLLGLPVATLLGGRFRTRMRMYHDEGPRNMLDKASCREWAAKDESRSGRLDRLQVRPAAHDARDGPGARPGQRQPAYHQELRDIRQGFENCREAIGWDYDIIVHCHWEHDLQYGHTTRRGRRSHEAAVRGRPDALGLLKRLGAFDESVAGAHRNRREPGAPPGLRGFPLAEGPAHRPVGRPQHRRAARIARRSPTLPTSISSR